jgi:ABC-type lipoprotein release transport system permease subunit
MLAISMAARNAFRYRRRTIITACAIAFGVTFTVFMDGFIAGSETETIRNLRDYETGELKVYAKGYFADREYLPFDRFMESRDRVAVERALEGRRWTPRVVLSCEIYFNDDSYPVPGSATARLYAVDPEREAQTLSSASKVAEGRWLAPGDGGIVLGSWLADDIGAKVGSPLTVECRGRGGFYQTFDAFVVGIARTDDPVINRDAAFIDLSEADALLVLDGGVTEYAARLGGSRSSGSWKRDYRADSEVRGINASLDASGVSCEARSWREIGEETLKLLRAQTGESALYLFFIFAIAIVGITNTMLMAVMERKGEIGMLRALGFSCARIRFLFLAEGAIVGLIGSLFGSGVGALLNWHFVARGMDFGFMLRDMDIGYRITGVIHSAWNVPAIARTLVATVAISASVAWFPSGIILKREVAEILRRQG